MGTTEIIVMAASIVGGTLLILAVVFGAIFGVSFLGIKGLAGSRAEAARQRYPTARLIVSSASFFGQESRAAAQARGNGTLVITDTEMIFERWLPQKEYVIALRSIKAIETPTSFLGKTRFTPLLKIVFQTEGGQQDSMAWQVADLNGVRRALESAM
jgi:hypothetical protein